MISIHALLAESDGLDDLLSAVVAISIHALLAESDRTPQRHHPLLRHFYPRSPCGERQVTEPLTISLLEFLSTLSLRRATSKGV